MTLESKADAFAAEVDDTLKAVLPGYWEVKAVPNKRRYVIQPCTDDERLERIPLYVAGEPLAELSVQFFCLLDISGDFLKTVKSAFAIFSILDANQPLVRQEFDESRKDAPAAHWRFHAERGSMSHLLTMSHFARPRFRDAPHALQSLHFPVGGSRFRPCLEDFLQFLIEECGIDALDDWQDAAREGREKWRRRQLRTVVRDLQGEAADTLRRAGWTVHEPDGWSNPEGGTLLRRW